MQQHPSAPARANGTAQKRFQREGSPSGTTRPVGIRHKPRTAATREASSGRVFRQLLFVYPLKAHPRLLPNAQTGTQNNAVSSRKLSLMPIRKQVAAEPLQVKPPSSPPPPSIDFQDRRLRQAKFCLVLVKEFNQRAHVEAVIKVYLLQARIFNFRNCDGLPD